MTSGSRFDSYRRFVQMYGRISSASRAIKLDGPLSLEERTGARTPSCRAAALRALVEELRASSSE